SDARCRASRRSGRRGGSRRSAPRASLILLWPKRPPFAKLHVRLAPHERRRRRSRAALDKGRRGRASSRQGRRAAKFRRRRRQQGGYGRIDCILQLRRGGFGRGEPLVALTSSLYVPVFERLTGTRPMGKNPGLAIGCDSLGI